jgi:uncharacterized Zn ribbon protein
MAIKDAKGNILKDGDAVKLIKDLKLKVTSTTIKRGYFHKEHSFKGQYRRN